VQILLASFCLVLRQLRENKTSGMADANTTSLSAISNLSVKIYHM